MASMDHHKPQQVTAEQSTILIQTKQPPNTTPEDTNAQAPGITQHTSPAKSSSMSRSGSMSQSAPYNRRSSRAGPRQSISAQPQDDQAAPVDYGHFDFTGDFDLDIGTLDDFIAFPDDEAFVGAFNEFNAIDWSQFNIWQNQAHPPQSPGLNGLPQQAFDWNQYVPSTPIDPALLQPHPVPHLVESAFQATPGLTAIPGTADITHMSMPMPMAVPGASIQPRASASHMQFQYPDPSSAFPPPVPYYWHPGYQSWVPQYTFQPPTTQPPALVYAHPPKSAKRARHDSDAESDDAPASKRQRATRLSPVPSESDSDNGKVTRAHARKTERRRESRESGVSSGSSIGKPNAIVPRIGEKPQRMEKKPWVRTNVSTKGETTRTARINGEANEKRKYKCMPLPNGDSWSNKYTFDYREHNGIHEFKEKGFTPRQIKDYILNYPSDNLKLWIQVAPADSARRYGSQYHSKCLFKDCPKHVYKDNGTIEVGHFQVAFDEKFKKHGNKVVDPFDVVGFVHLYCLERFCDFAEICQWADVEVDTRVDLPREPRQAKWTLSGRPEAEPAQSFLRACKNGNPRSHKSFTHYPVHVSGQSKAFGHTVTAAMVERNIEHRTASQIKQFVERNLTPSTLLISCGDLDLAMTHKKIKQLQAYKETKHKDDFDFTAYYDDFDPVINQRIAHWEARNIELQSQPKTGRGRRGGTKATHTTTTTTASKRKAAHFIDEDDDEDDLIDVPPTPDILDFGRNTWGPDPNPRTRATRSSPRKKARVDYTGQVGEPSPQWPPLAMINEAHATHQPQWHPSGIPMGYLPAASNHERRDSLSHLLPAVSEQHYNLDDYANIQLDGTTGMTQEQIDRLIELQRRQSSVASMRLAKSPPVRKAGRGNGTAKVTSTANATQATRKASFPSQPVSDRKVFDGDEPPNMVKGRRRSVRLAGKA